MDFALRIAVHTVAAQWANIKGPVLLRNGFSAEGEVRLFGAKIGGNLECDNGSFKNANGMALTAERANVGGSVLLRNVFNATSAYLSRLKPNSAMVNPTLSLTVDTEPSYDFGANFAIRIPCICVPRIVDGRFGTKCGVSSVCRPALRRGSEHL